MAESEQRDRTTVPDGHLPVTELAAERPGPLSPFGEDVEFPLPLNLLRYAHPTDRPNRAGIMAGEGRKR